MSVADSGMSEKAHLSRMLWDARENLSMWADVVEADSGKPAESVRRLVRQIDEFRTEQGWSPHGFGGEM